MARYGVQLPITGIVYVEVEADDEKAAIEAAFEADLNAENIEEWEAHEDVTRGNISYGSLGRAVAEKLEDE